MPGNKLVENFDNLDQFIDEDEKWLKPLFLEVGTQHRWRPRSRDSTERAHENRCHFR